MNLDNLKSIINSREIRPKIINEASNFIVVTYWWGRNINNQNTSRPCISFFEKFILQVQSLCIKTLGTSSARISIQQIYTRLESIVESLKSFKTIVDNTAKAYNEMIFEQLEVLPSEGNRDNVAAMKLEKMKEMYKTPANFEYKNQEYAKRLFTIIILQAISIIKDNILLIYDTNNKIKLLKDSFLSREQLVTPNEKEEFLKQIDDLNKILSTQKTLIKKKINTKQPSYSNEEMKEFAGMSIFEIFHKEFRFFNPMTYDKMIEKWEAECERFNCNHMAVEYPEFALTGGYQMAINAKPLFIKKSLEVAGNRSVLYIDGDMFIRKYPKLFDLPDVDFMARGWWVDPRSSWKMEESITYDPYTFETSGGTMMFSQSLEARELINKWIEISSKSYQVGKADDRILSLVFNTYKFLCSMKIIQLPIEYLWLTLDYDERMLDLVYDYDSFKMKESIFIEHSECLTSEDTATGSGAASDRTPKFYNYLEENIEPVSEQYHEYIMFPSIDMVETLKTYLTYMSGVQYINDGNELLLKKGLVNLENPKENEQPLYITKYNDKYGNIKYPQDNSLTYNQVAEINMKRVEQMNTTDLGLVTREDNIVEINNFTNLMKEEDPSKYNHSKIMSLIIKLLREGKEVIYNPTAMPGYDKIYYDILLEKNQKTYKSMEMIVVPDFSGVNSKSSNYFYKPLIRTNQPLMFKPSELLIKFLMMFLSLDDLSAYLNNGSYEFMSRIRVGYLIKKRINASSTQLVGGNNKDFDLYEEGIDILYKGGKNYGKNHIKNKKLKNKTKKNNKLKNKLTQKNKMKNNKFRYNKFNKFKVKGIKTQKNKHRKLHKTRKI